MWIGRKKQPTTAVRARWHRIMGGSQTRRRREEAWSLRSGCASTLSWLSLDHAPSIASVATPCMASSTWPIRPRSWTMAQGRNWPFCPFLPWPAEIDHLPPHLGYHYQIVARHTFSSKSRQAVSCPCIISTLYLGDIPILSYPIQGKYVVL